MYQSLPLLMASLLFCAGSALAQAPRIFFTDLTSGPNSGGESVGSYSGAYVTIYGNNFGASQGSSTVTLNGQNCMRVVSWGTSWLWYQKIVVQLGSSCSSGNFSITVNGQPSTAATITISGATVNPAAFTVRAGNIYCVSNSGSDSSSGKFPSSCWKTISKAVHTIAAGDTAYVQDGVFASSQDPAAPYNAAISVTAAGTPSSPKALVAYPGAVAGVNTSQDGIRNPNISATFTDWVFAGLSITTTATAAFSQQAGRQRIVGNTLSCPNGTGSSACVEIRDGNYFFYGNLMTTAGRVGADKTYHGVYFSTKNDHTDVGWNDIHNVRGCRGIQFHQDGGPDMTDIHVHDNLIHDTVCDGINLHVMNADAGPVEAFNNVLYNVGKGPAPPDGSSIYTCFNVASVSSRTNPVQIFNNTCYNAGTSNGGDSSTTGAIAASTPTVLRNNLFYQANGQPYIASFTGCGQIKSGSANNNWYGNGNAPSCSGLSNNRNVDPKVVSTSTPDFRLQSTSPIIDAGVTIAGLTGDRNGVVRPQGSAYDIGAAEYFTGSGQVQLTCDLDGNGVVNSADVQIASNQVLNAATCGSSDLDQNGACNVIDVQRVINAASGQACRIGP